jgi:hypothetical protein
LEKKHNPFDAICLAGALAKAEALRCNAVAGKKVEIAVDALGAFLYSATLQFENRKA